MSATGTANSSAAANQAGGGGGGGGGGGNGGGGASGAGASGGAGGGALPRFSLTPGQAPSGIIDYSTKAGKKSFYQDTAKLPEIFDGMSEGVTLFQSQLQDKAKASGWDNGEDTEDIINIPTQLALSNDTRDLIQEYSQLTTQMIIAWAVAQVILANNRKTQNNYNMYMCMKNSLTKEMQNSMELEQEQYTVQNTVVAALFYQILMSKAEVGTQATIALTRNSLTKLDQKMLELDSNVNDFNEFVKSCKRKLTNCRANSNNLLINLFTGYKAARDSRFVETIDKIEEDYMYGKTPNLTDTQLMDQALKAFQVCVERGVWGSLSTEQEMIVAMQAKFDEIKDSCLKLDQPTKKKDKKKKPKKRSDQGTTPPTTDNESKYAWKKK
jgi:hypothetical protein